MNQNSENHYIPVETEEKNKELHFYEAKVDQADTLFTQYFGEEKLTKQEREIICEKIREGVELTPQNEKGQMVKNKALSEEKFLDLLENIGGEEFNLYLERYQTQLNSTLLEFMDGENVHERVQTLKNRSHLIELAKYRRSIIKF